MTLTDAQKAELMRKGNLLFNEGRYFEAGKVFTTIGYKTGLIRLGDFFYFDKEMPLVAYGFYRNANHKPMLDKIGDSFVFALKCLLSDDASEKPKAEKTVMQNGEDDYKVRNANSPDTGLTTPETMENKVSRAVAMLRRLS